MNKQEQEFVRNAIKQVMPEHLDGFDKGWLHIKEIELNNSKYIKLYTEKEDGRKHLFNVNI